MGDPRGLAAPFISVTVTGTGGATISDAQGDMRIDGHPAIVQQKAVDAFSALYQSGGHSISVVSWGVNRDELAASLQGLRLTDGALQLPNLPARLHLVPAARLRPLSATLFYEPTTNPDPTHRVPPLTLTILQDPAAAYEQLGDDIDSQTGPAAQQGPRTVAGHPAVTLLWPPLPDGTVQLAMTWRDDEHHRSVSLRGRLSNEAQLPTVVDALREIDDRAWAALHPACLPATAAPTTC